MSRREEEGIGDPTSSPTTTMIASKSTKNVQCHAPDLDDASSYGYYDALYSHLRNTDFANSNRVGSAEVIPPLTDESQSPILTNTELALLRIDFIFPFTRQKRDGNGGITLSDPRTRKTNAEYIAGVGKLLAIHHFNNGIGTVVPEISGINETCPIRFVLDNFSDSEGSQRRAIEIFNHNVMVKSPEHHPALLFGAWRSAVTIPLAVSSGIYKIPHVSSASTSPELDDTLQYRYFSRLIPSDFGTARALVDYLRTRMDLEYLGIVYVNDGYGTGFHLAIQEASAERPEGDRVNVKGFPFKYSYNRFYLAEDKKEIALALQQLKETRFKVFIGIFYDIHYDLVMEAAHSFGLVGHDYLWIVGDGVSEGYLHNRQYPKGSPLDIASRGMGIIKAEGGRETREGNTGFDRLTKAYYDQDEKSVSWFNCKQPTTNSINDPSRYFKPNVDWFKERKSYPSAVTAFSYDAIVGMGMAACNLHKEKGDAYFTGPELFNAFVDNTFDGASGHVIIDSETTSRDPKSAFFVLYNAVGFSTGNMTTFKVRSVSQTIPNRDITSSLVIWKDMEGEQYIYSDGSTNHPDVLPALEGEDLNQLSSGLRGAGLALAGLIFAVSIGFSFWTYWHRNVRVVKASQPIFLHMICLGTLVMGATIVTLSIDDGVASESGCDVACMLSPWFLSYGFVIAFSALFSKTWRINKIFHNPQLKRIKVTTRDVILPFIILMVLNTTVLIVWTVVSPLTWHRRARGEPDDFKRPLDSYGICIDDNDDYIVYVVLLLVINLMVLLLANFQAYQARGITTEFSESNYIALIMAFMLQAFFIGVPVMILVADEPSASFFVQTGIIFVICISTLLLIFVPKMIHMKTYLKAQAEKKRLKEERQKARERAMKEAYKVSDIVDPSKKEPSTASASSDEKTAGTDSTKTADSPHGNSDSDMNVDNDQPTQDKPPNKRPLADQDAQRMDSNDEEVAVGIVGVDVLGKSTSENLQEERRRFPVAARRRSTPTSFRGSDITDDGTFGLQVLVHPQAEKRLNEENHNMKMERLELMNKIQSLRNRLDRKGMRNSVEDPTKRSVLEARKPSARFSSVTFEGFDGDGDDGDDVVANSFQSDRRERRRSSDPTGTFARSCANLEEHDSD